MTRTLFTLAEANHAVQILVGLPVSLAWKSDGSVMFLELGRLASPRTARLQHERGEATICLYTKWRVEEGARVLCGSENGYPAIEACIQNLHGVVIEAFSIHGQVPELHINFSNGQRLISATMVKGDSDWQIRMPDASWISCEDGVVGTGDDDESRLAAVEDTSFDSFEHAMATANRWGIQSADLKEKICGECIYMIRLDGDSYFENYGVCTSEISQFDGRVVDASNGCKSFMAKKS